MILEDDGHGVSRRIMAVGMISLLLIVMFVVLLHIYARHLLECQERRLQASINSLRTGVAPVGLNSSEPQRRGLDPSVILSLPVFIYQPVDGLDGGDGVECSVCLIGIEEGAKVRPLPNCKHMFHAECIDIWLSSNTTCPVCRTEAEPLPTADPVVPPAPPTASALEEGTSDGGPQLQKMSGSSFRLSSFRRILSRERSSRRIHNHEDEEEAGAENL